MKLFGTDASLFFLLYPLSLHLPLFITPSPPTTQRKCDLHYTTDVVTIPEMNAKCTRPFGSVDQDGKNVEPLCCATDFTLEEIKTLCAKMEGRGPLDGTPEQYAFDGTASWRTDVYAYPNVSCPKVLSHRESVELIDSFDRYFTPELKAPQVDMPFTTPDGTAYTYDDYRQALVDEYIELGIPPEKVSRLQVGVMLCVRASVRDFVIWSINSQSLTERTHIFGHSSCFRNTLPIRFGCNPLFLTIFCFGSRTLVTLANKRQHLI
jgi:hypothetical protein